MRSSALGDLDVLGLGFFFAISATRFMPAFLRRWRAEDRAESASPLEGEDVGGALLLLRRGWRRP